jgi:hypothetical protein
LQQLENPMHEKLEIVVPAQKPVAFQSSSIVEEIKNKLEKSNLPLTDEQKQKQLE